MRKFVQKSPHPIQDVITRLLMFENRSNSLGSGYLSLSAHPHLLLKFSRNMSNRDIDASPSPNGDIGIEILADRIVSMTVKSIALSRSSMSAAIFSFCSFSASSFCGLSASARSSSHLSRVPIPRMIRTIGICARKRNPSA